MPRPAPLVLAAALPALLLACNGNHVVTTPGRGNLAVICQTLNATVPAGSSTALPVTFLVTRGGTATSGESVVFTASAGDVAPDVVLSGGSGTATSSFMAPASAATVLVTGRVTDPGEEAFDTCTVSVTGTTNPRVSVAVTAPAQLAGITVRVQYDGSVLSLVSPGIESVGPLAAGGCVSQSTDNGTTAQLLQACPTLHAVAGSEVGRFTFADTGPVQSAADFQVTCDGVDETGASVATFCSTTVTQL